MSLPRRWLAALAGGAALFTPGGVGWADPGTGMRPVVALHVAAPTTQPQTLCTTYRPIDPNHPGGQLACSDFETLGALCTPYVVYLVVARVDSAKGVTGVSLGIEYNGNPGAGVDVSNWKPCNTGLEFKNVGPRGEWPAAGGGEPHHLD